MPIPHDLLDFLSRPENRKVTLTEGEVRQIELYSPEELRIQKFTVDGNELFLNGPLSFDPGETREYEGYPLVKRCNDYSPDGVLVWFPEFSAYGAADCGHGRILLYPGVSWSQICREPTWYYNGQWYPQRVPHKEVNPWQKKPWWRFW
jgi:hypothetical protein